MDAQKSETANDNDGNSAKTNKAQTSMENAANLASNVASTASTAAKSAIALISDPKKIYEALKSMKESTVAIIVAVICGLIGIVMIIYIVHIKSLQKSECTSMDTLYKNATTTIQSAASMADTDPDCSYYLRDYYIKSAYNCCSGGSYKNDFVDTCIVKDIITQGVRCLDFEIYSIQDQPVIATSTVDSYYIKETYNSASFSDFMSTVANNAFSSTAPNPQDPMFLHFRIKSNNDKMFSNMAAILMNYDYLMLGPKYSFEFTQCNKGTDKTQNVQCFSKNLGSVKLSDLKGKIVILVDNSNTSFSDNKNFYEFVNATTNSIFMRALSYYDVKFTPDMNELIEYNRQAMTLCLPDSGSSPDNPSGIVTREMGCQITAMRYNVVDQNLEEFNAFFEKAGYAFVLKPERLRYQMVTIEPTPENDPLLSFAPRTSKTDYYNFTI